MTDFDLALGRLVTLRRKQKNLTQVVLAKRTGISQPRISRVESGQSLTIDEFTRLAGVLYKDTTKMWWEAAGQSKA